MTLKEKLKNLPSTSGVYLMQDSRGRILYIGKASCLKKRVGSYFSSPSNQSLKNAVMISQVKKIDYLVTKSEKESLLLESNLIRKYQPRYNILWRDDKSYPYLKLTLNEDFPRLFLARNQEGEVITSRRKVSGTKSPVGRKVPVGDLVPLRGTSSLYGRPHLFTRGKQLKNKDALYFGPYTEVGEVRRILRWLQRIFPLRLCKYTINKDRLLPEKKVRSCLYYHIQQCPAPCLKKISQEKYQEIVAQVILFLEGKYEELHNYLEKQMHQSAKALAFEEAKKIRDTIMAIKNMTERIDFKEIKKEDLSEKIKTTRGLSELKRILSLPKVPLYIEAFDVSNISGKQAVGSSVVFERGEANKNLYRKYRIKTVEGIDDYKMISEILSRRYRRILEAGEKLPDLILIDGGKGHLSTAVKTLNTLHLPPPCHRFSGVSERGLRKLPVIALAKEKEEIYLPSEALAKGGLPARSKPLTLPANSPALQLLQRIRDEAHRFALSYHKLLRKKEKFGK